MSVPKMPETPSLRAVTTITDVSEVTSTRGAVAAVRDWMGRFVVPVDDADLDLLALWIVHTHFHDQIGTTPRLTIASPLPEAGKTTCLEHMQRLAYQPVQMGSLSSPAMLTRLLDASMRTLLIDEVDRNLSPDREGVGELLAVLNSGYKRGATRPTTVKDGSGGWVVAELPTFAPAAMAGISPHLPADTASRTLTVLLLPDWQGAAEDSDWEEMEDECLAVAESLAEWVAVTDLPRPDLPDGIRGRAKERWRPLWRVAHAAGGDWPERCRVLIERETEHLEHDKEEGLMQTHPAIALLRDVATEWPPGLEVWRTDEIVQALVTRHAERWGPSAQYPKGLTKQRVGRYLSRNFGLRSAKRSDGRKAGYALDDFTRLAHRLHLPPPGETSETSGTAETTRGDNR